MQTFFVETWGCQMNVLDSQRLEGLLRARGLRPAARAEEADVALLNTCAVREKAVQKVLSRLVELHRRREESGLPKVVGLCGCVAEQEGAQLLQRLPVVGFILGPGRVEDVGAALDLHAAGERAQKLGFDASSYTPDLIARPGSARQYITVVHGCNQRCTYCVVPQTRGPEVSRRLTEIVREAESLAHRGVKEITLLGQTVNAYRCPETGADFADLLRAVCAIEALWCVQLVTSHPRFFTERLIDAMAGLPRLGTYLHMPVQSGSDRILRRMARRYTRARYLDAVRRLREARPELSLSTDVIVGFPGETDAEFEETLHLVEEVRFGQLYGFVYSPRAGTPAVALDSERLPRAVTKARITHLFAVQSEIQLAINRTLVSRVAEVLVDGPARHGADLWHGRGRDNRVVNFPAWEGVRAGDLAAVEVTGASAHSLLGRRASASGAGERPSPGLTGRRP